MLEPQAGISILTLFQGLGYCLIAFFVGIHLYRKYVLKQSGPSKRHMRVIERLPLSSKSSLLMVEVDGRRVLMALGSERASFLTEPLIEGDAMAGLAVAPGQEEAPFSAFQENQKTGICQAAN